MEIDNVLDINQVKQVISDGLPHYFKYVRVGNEYLFGEQVSVYGDPDHQTIALKFKLMGKGDPISAGEMKIRKDMLIVEGSSMMLKLGPAMDDEENLSKLLNVPIGNRYE